MNEVYAVAPAEIPGYDFGNPKIDPSPVSEDDLRLLEQTVGWKESDSSLLQKHAALFRQQAEHMVDSWRSVIGEQAHLAKLFFGPNGKADEEYKARVKRRFVQWVIDVALRQHDRDWLNYQEEIGLRHTPAKKNVTDGKQTSPFVPLRYILGFIPVILPIRSFFATAIEDEAELKNLEDAWAKAVLLHITLWCRPFVSQGLW